PDDENPEDETVMAVPLAAPIASGADVRIEVAWTAHVPRTFARTGAIDNFFFIAQWFPKLGVLEDAGWNCHQFPASPEFFSDYGVYDVSLTVPADWIVGATGARQRVGTTLEPHRSPAPAESSPATHRYSQADGHAFA